MSAPAPATRLSTMWTNHAGRFLRYSGVSMINVVLGQLLLVGFHAGLGMEVVLANVLAVVLGSVPSFILNKRYVWRRQGPVSLRTEMVPFWGMNAVGLILSTLAVSLVRHLSEATIVIMLASLTAWGSVWVIKYTLLDKLLFREPAIARG